MADSTPSDRQVTSRLGGAAVSGMQERAARALADATNVPFVGAKQRRIAAAVLALAADVDEIAGAIRAHQPTTGMSVASGVTCQCGYWNGNEIAGKTRPVGFSGLQWHQAEQVAAHIAPLAAQAADVGACGANGGDQAVGPVAPEPGGHGAMWDGGGGWL